MSRLSQCDACEVQEPDDHAVMNKWYKLTAQMDYGFRREFDVCPKCVAKIIPRNVLTASAFRGPLTQGETAT